MLSVPATIRSEGQFNSIIYEEKDSYRQTTTRWCVLMNPSDMEALDIGSDDRVTMRSDRGEMAGLTVCPVDVPAGYMLAYYREAKLLTSNTADPRSKTSPFKSIPVAVLKEG